MRAARKANVVQQARKRAMSRRGAQGTAGGREVVKKVFVEFSRVRKFSDCQEDPVLEKLVREILKLKKGRSERGAHNLLENEAGNARTEGRERLIIVVRVQEVYRKKKRG